MRTLNALIVLALAVGLTSCAGTKPVETPTPVNTGKVITVDTGKTIEPTPVATNCTTVPPMDAAALKIYETGDNPSAPSGSIGSGSLAFVNYTLRTCTADGKILDTSRAADAKIAGIFQEGRPYEPFQTIIGTHQTVRGFEYGLIGMKK